jgi:hypothetical protein
VTYGNDGQSRKDGNTVWTPAKQKKLGEEKRYRKRTFGFVSRWSLRQKPLTATKLWTASLPYVTAIRQFKCKKQDYGQFME